MKKVKRNGLRLEYHQEDLGRGIRGKYLKGYRASTNLILLDPEVAAAFPTDRAVNEALSSLIEVAEQVGLKRRSSRR